jgi:hypothetical protein
VAEEQTVPTSVESTSEPTVMTFEQASAAALKEVEESETDAEQQETAAPDGKAETAPETSVEEPEHVKWAKSVSGNVDDKGNLVVDRILKQAFELNRQNQTTVQQLTYLNQALRHPEIAAAIQRVISGGQPQAPEPKAAEEKSEADVLRDHIRAVVSEQIKPVQEDSKALLDHLVLTECNLTYQQLCDEFGKAEFDSVGPLINQQLATAAQQSGMTLNDLIRSLVKSKSLHSVYSSTARSLLYDRVKQAKAQEVKAAERKEIETKKKLTPVPAGSSGKGAVKVPREIKTFEDAVKAAEEELAQQTG